jgi:hypothetical protein
MIPLIINENYLDWINEISQIDYKFLGKEKLFT